MIEQIELLNSRFKNTKPESIIEYFIKESSHKISLSSSFGLEDQVISHMMLQISNDVNIFTLDTGRLPCETYNVMDSTNLKYNTKVDVYFPNSSDVENLYKKQGINGFYESIQNRKECCNIRKIKPLKRALKNVDIWITGLRSSQSITRKDILQFSWDENNNIIKFNPLINWRYEEVLNYIKKYNIPYNKLHDQGYPSIGCAPCTRAIKENEDIRSGRWWWEDPKHKECGLHK